MASAYTPGLTVSPDTLIRRTRRLPLKGEVVVRVGDRVGPETVVARALLPGVMRTVKAAESLGLSRIAWSKSGMARSNWPCME